MTALEIIGLVCGGLFLFALGAVSVACYLAYRITKGF